MDNLKSKQRCERPVIIEQEEYKALMAELPTPEIELEPTLTAAEIHEKFRKIEFYILIIIGLILVIFILLQK